MSPKPGVNSSPAPHLQVLFAFPVKYLLLNKFEEGKYLSNDKIWMLVCVFIFPHKGKYLSNDKYWMFHNVVEYIFLDIHE